MKRRQVGNAYSEEQRGDFVDAANFLLRNKVRVTQQFISKFTLAFNEKHGTHRRPSALAAQINIARKVARTEATKTVQPSDPRISDTWRVFPNDVTIQTLLEYLSVRVKHLESEKLHLQTQLTSAQNRLAALQSLVDAVSKYTQEGEGDSK